MRGVRQLNREDIDVLAAALREPLAEARDAAARGRFNGWAANNPGWVLLITILIGLISPMRDQVEWMWDDESSTHVTVVVQNNAPPMDPTLLDKLIDERVENAVERELDERAGRCDDHGRRGSGPTPGDQLAPDRSAPKSPASCSPSRCHVISSLSFDRPASVRVGSQPLAA